MQLLSVSNRDSECWPQKQKVSYCTDRPAPSRAAAADPGGSSPRTLLSQLQRGTSHVVRKGQRLEQSPNQAPVQERGRRSRAHCPQGSNVRQRQLENVEEKRYPWQEWLKHNNTEPGTTPNKKTWGSFLVENGQSSRRLLGPAKCRKRLLMKGMTLQGASR